MGELTREWILAEFAVKQTTQKGTDLPTKLPHFKIGTRGAYSWKNVCRLNFGL